LPTAKQHLGQATRNEKLAATLSKTEYREWTVTVIFYSAVHYIEAFLAGHGHHCDDHAERNERIAEIPQLRTIRKEYDTLRTLSRQARYHALPIEPDDVNVAQQKLETIRSHIMYMLTGKRV
jgi:hypothetical protein